MSSHDLSRRIASAARALQDEIGSQHTMERGLQLAIDMVDGCEHAGISLVHRGRIDSPATSSEVVRRVQELQHAYGEGPCVDAILENEVVHSSDLAGDGRWPQWGPVTVEQTGIRSMLCFRLFTTQERVGALNLYSTRAGAFGPDDVEHGLALSAHLALAYVASHEIETLNLALDTRTLIGQAAGILMERHQLDGDRAFAVLKRVSQETNRKLRDVARELVLTRTLPQPPGWLEHD
jgi:GAF domain-containing protein